MSLAWKSVRVSTPLRVLTRLASLNFRLSCGRGSKEVRTEKVNFLK